MPVEVRMQNNAIDEICIHRGNVHIEQMDGNSWFMGVDACDGSYWQFWFGAKNRKSLVEFRHTETVSAEEQSARAALAPHDKTDVRKFKITSYPSVLMGEGPHDKTEG